MEEHADPYLEYICNYWMPMFKKIIEERTILYQVIQKAKQVED